MIFDHLEKYAEQIALIHGNVVITYRQLLQLSEEYLKEIPQRSVVLFVCENTLSSIALYVGMMRKKIIPVMISPNIKKRHFRIWLIYIILILSSMEKKKFSLNT